MTSDQATLRIIESMINGKISGYEKGLQMLNEDSSVSESSKETMIRLVSFTLKDLKDLKEFIENSKK